MLKRTGNGSFAFVLAFAFALTGCSGGATIGGTPAGSSGSGVQASPSPGASASSSTSPSPNASATPVPGTSAAPGTTASSAAATVACGPANSPEPAIPFPSATDADAFYAQPSPFPALPHGTILASRSVTYAPLGTTMSNKAYELKFVSCDRYNQPIAAVATVVLPLTPVASGPEPLLSHQLFEDSLGPQCAPSHAETGSTTQGLSLDTTVPSGALSSGWTLVVPDHEGPYSEYVVGAVEGHVTLDAIAAAESYAPAGLNAKTPVGMYGYSGGAEASAWAASMQQAYQPNLNIVGVATGGTPADIHGAFSAVDGSTALDEADNAGFFDIIYMSAVGLNRGYPTFFGPTLNTAGIAASEAMENGCGGKYSDGSGGPTGHFADFQTVSNWLSLPADVAVEAAGSLPQPGARPITNYFLYSSVDDEIIPIAGVDNLYAGWCADGSTVEYFRDPAGGDHNTMAVNGFPLVLAYFTSIFGGTGPTVPPTSMTCN